MRVFVRESLVACVGFPGKTREFETRLGVLGWLKYPKDGQGLFKLAILDHLLISRILGSDTPIIY